MSRPFFDHFRLVAPIYEHVFGGVSSHESVARRLALPVDGWLLDAGGGTGRVSQNLRPQTSGVIVADASHGMLRQSRAKDGLHPVHSQVERLPFPDGHFARIVIVDAFHHFFDYAAAATELWRVLAPGGRLVIQEPNIARWPIKLIALGEKLLLMRSKFYRADELAALFTGPNDAQVTVDTDDDPLYIFLVADKAPASEIDRAAD